MKTLYVLLVCFFCLPLVFLGCGETQESSSLIGATDSAQALPADDDIQGLYNLGVPRNWDQTQDSVVYVKYFRAKLLRRFGNIPEVHTIADMELKRRQGPALTHDEQITYLKALYELSPDEGILPTLANNEQVRAAPSFLTVDKEGSSSLAKEVTGKGNDNGKTANALSDFVVNFVANLGRD